MEYKNDDLKVRMVVKDRPTVKEQLEYYGFATLAINADMWIRLWKAAQVLITEWESELVRDPKRVDFDLETDPDVTQLAIWVGITVKAHVNKLEAVPKN